MIIKLKYEKRDKHTHARIFMGPNPDHLTLCGNLMFGEAEFHVFKRAMADAKLLNPGLEVILCDSAGGSSSSFPKVQLPPGSGDTAV